MTLETLDPAMFRAPAIMLSGEVGYPMYEKFRDQFAASLENDLVVIELSTPGGDPEVARMMGEDVRFHSDLQPNKRPRKGSDLLGRHDVHELLRQAEPLSDARHKADGAETSITAQPEVVPGAKPKAAGERSAANS